jgi:hypothetical protein
MKITLKMKPERSLQHNGKTYRNGDTLDMKDEDATALIQSGHACEPEPEPEPEPTTKTGKSRK